MRSPANLVRRSAHHPAQTEDKAVSISQIEKRRSWLVAGIFILLGIIILAKLFYLQIATGPELAALAENQYFKNYQLTGSRGKIYTTDGYLLVGNKEVYRFYLDNKVYQNLVNNGTQPATYRQIAESIAPILLSDQPQIDLGTTDETENSLAKATANDEQTETENLPFFATQKKAGSSDTTTTNSSSTADSQSDNLDFQLSLTELINQLTEKMITKNDQQTAKNRWGNITLDSKVSATAKEKLLALNDQYFAFEPYEVRNYPESSMAAQIVGFVGKNQNGIDTGYFGIEGALDMELQGRTAQRTVEVDATLQPLNYQSDLAQAASNGRDVYLTIRRDLQNYVEEKLAESLAKYGAEAGEVIIMEPKTGAILAWATLPSYQPEYYNYFDPQIYNNPSLADNFEPGSIFKLITVAAGIDTGVISPDTVCPRCSGPRVFGAYTIKTWNEVYNPGITMTEALEKSDNTAMIYITDLLGKDRFIDYLNRFKISQATGLEIQEDTTTPWPETWYPVELATRSFGQGIVANSIQMMRAVGAIANQGMMLQPHIVSRVVDPATGEEFVSETVTVGQPISAQTAQTLTTMMEASAQHGEAQWLYKNSYQMAGKTGTSQIAGKSGYKDEYGTVASFIGFAPSTDPKFVMLVKMRRPQSSVYAAETSAVLWKELAEQLLTIL